MEKVLGFSIEIKGQESELSKMSDLKREIIAVENQINKLKDATKGNVGAQKASATQMAEMNANLKTLKKEYSENEKKVIDNTRALNNAKGSYNALVAENKRLSAELRAMPIDATNAKFKQLQQQLVANTDKLKDFDKEIGRSFRNVGNYGDSLKSIAGSLGIAFGLNEIVSFGKEAVQTAAKVEGIERAFRALNKPGLLDELREATKGTVSDMELMKAAVSANNFQIPLETMANLLKFAQQRAQETGQSVDYLVESIVTGIARKSPLILDNLGINVQRINTKFKQTGDFAKAAGIVVQEELTKQGDLALTTADKIDRLSVRWDHFKTTVGEALIQAGAGFEDLLSRISGNKNEAMEKVAQSVTGTKDFYKKEFESIVQTAKLSEANRLKAIKDNEVQIKLALESAQQSKSAAQRASYAQEALMRQQFNDRLLNLNKEFAKQYTDEEIKAMEEARKKKEDEIKKNNELILKLSEELAKGQIDLMKSGLEKDVATVELRYDQEINALKRQEIKKKKLRDDEIKANESLNKRIAQLEKLKQQEIEALGNKALKDNESLAYKKLEIEEQIAIENAKQSYDNEEEKQEAILQIQKDYAQQKIDLLQASSEAETDEVKLQIARLQTVIDSELKTKKPKKGESPFEKMFGTDAETAKVAIDSALQLAKQISDAIFEAQSARNQRLLDNNLQAIEAQSETELMLLENRLRNGQITEAQFAQEKKEIDAKQRQDEIAAKREAFEKEKKLKKQQIAITLALELIKIAAAYAEIPYVGWATAAIQAAAATAAAGVQMAVIDNQKFSLGGVAKGPSHANGGIPFTVQGRGGYEMEGGEAIINKRSTAMFGGLLSVVNQLGGGKKFAQGGIPLPMSNNNSILPQLGLNMDSFAERIVSGINNKKVYQTESDVRGVIQRVAQIESESTF